MSETPYQAQRRKLSELKEKQGDAGQATPKISAKAQKRRDAEAESKPFASKSQERRVTAQKKVSKKTSSTETTL